MRIVVSSALLLALMVALPSIAPAQSRDDGGHSGYKAQQDEDASVVSTGSHSGQPVNLPGRWVRESDSDTPFQDVAGSQGDDGATAYQQDGDPPAAGQEYTEGAPQDGDAAKTIEGEGGSDDRYSDTAQTVEGEGGSDYRYGDTARTSEGDGNGEYRYGDTVGTTEGGSDYRYGDTLAVSRTSATILIPVVTARPTAAAMARRRDPAAA